MDSQDPWKENRWANTTTWTFSSTPGVQRRWCWYHVFVVTKMGDMGHVLVTSPSPSAQAQSARTKKNHHHHRVLDGCAYLCDMSYLRDQAGRVAVQHKTNP